MALEILFWLVPKFTVSAVAVSFLGFFLGPLFPAVIVSTFFPPFLPTLSLCVLLPSRRC